MVWSTMARHSDSDIASAFRIRSVVACAADPFRSLAAAIEFFPEDRWSASTIAAAMSFAASQVATLSPMAWAQLLDRVEAALATVLADLPALNEIARAASH